MICPKRFFIPARDRLPSELVPWPAFLRIEDLLSRLPEVATAHILECRLGGTGVSDSDRVDYSMAVLPGTGGLETLAREWLVTDGAGSEKGLEPIRTFLRRCLDPDSSLRHTVSHLWLEFDLPKEVRKVENALPTPSLFFSPWNPFASRKDWSTFLHQAFSCFSFPIQNPAERAKHAIEFRETLPETAFFRQVGVMISRKTPGTRLVVDGLAPELLPGFLQQAGWSGSFTLLEESLNQIFHEIPYSKVDFDLSDSLDPVLALEFSVMTATVPETQAFLARLIEKGWCNAEKQQALEPFMEWQFFSWERGEQGAPHPFGNQSPQRQRKRETAALLSATQVGCRLNHLKVSLGEDGSVTTKAYLSFLAVADFQGPGSETTLDPSLSIAESQNRAGMNAE
jgi:hypothetical protein